MATNNQQNYRSLEEIRQRKNELRIQLDRDSQKINKLWSGVFVKRDEATKGEFIANVISNGALAIDAFLMMRKLHKSYNTFSGFFKRKKG